MAQDRGTAPRESGRRIGRVGSSRRAPAPRPGARPGGGSGRKPSAGPGSLRPRLTGRAAVLVLVLAALMVSYASSLRAYVDQRHHIGALHASIAQSQQDISALEREKQRWRDRAYVIAQARARFAFGFPGEIGYQVLDEDGQPLDHSDSLSAPRTLEDPDPEWWQTTLTSIDSAGHPPKEAAAPAEKITAPAPASPDR